MNWDRTKLNLLSNYTQVEVKRAIPRSRILPNGTTLSPNSSPLIKPIHQPALIRSLDIPKGYINTEQSMGIANSKLRHDVRRSASVGDPSMMMGHMLGKPLIASRPAALAASIAAIGVPSPRSRQKTTASDIIQFSSNSGLSPPISKGGMGGASYASALRVGANIDDSETSITDQMMIAGLKSDLYAFGGGSSDHSYLFRMHDNSSTIERPPRSYSEPVIQLPESMVGMDYFRNQIKQGMGVGALGGAFNPQPPLQSIYEDSSPARLQKPIRSPVLSSQPPSSVLSPLGLSWLNSSLSNTTDAMHLQGTGDLFPPLSLPISSNMTGDNLSAKREYQQPQYEHHKQDFFQSQMGTSSRHSGQIDEIGIPTPSAWASMLMSLPSSSISPQVPRQQRHDNGQNSMQKSSVHVPQQSSEVNQQDVALGFYSLHDQQSQELNYSYQTQHEGSSAQQQTVLQQGYFQQQPLLPSSYEKYVQGDSNNNYNFSPPQSQWNTYSPVSVLGNVISGSVAGSGLGSGAASRSGSLLESVGHVSLTSGTTDKDELFLYEDLRLDGDAPEFEPQTLPAAYRAW